MEMMVGRGVLRSEETEISSEGIRCLYSFRMTFSRLAMILTIGNRGWPLESTGSFESLLVDI